MFFILAIGRIIRFYIWVECAFVAFSGYLVATFPALVEIYAAIGVNGQAVSDGESASGKYYARYLG